MNYIFGHPVEFADPSSVFARGFELGIVWRMMDEGAECLGTPEKPVLIAVDSEGVLMDLCIQFGYTLIVSLRDENFIYTVMVKNAAKPVKLKPHLSLVKKPDTQT